MRVIILLGWFVGLFLMTLLQPVARVRGAQPEEALLEAINRLPEPERQARLVTGAKKEGAVTWYVAMNRAYAQELINAFEADYPFVKVNALTASGGALLSRVVTEYRAKSYLYDVFNTRSTTIIRCGKPTPLFATARHTAGSCAMGFTIRKVFLTVFLPRRWFSPSTPSS